MEKKKIRNKHKNNVKVNKPRKEIEAEEKEECKREQTQEIKKSYKRKKKK